MFCKNCGTEIDEKVRFCPKCGFNRTDDVVQQERRIVKDNKIKYQIKPKFNILYKLLSNLWKATIVMVYIFFILENSDKLIFSYSSIRLITVGVILICIILKMIFEKIQYNSLEYNFYTTKIEYKDGFLNKEEKELKYRYIREITMNQNLLERFCGIGTIRIFTNASSGVYSFQSGHNDMKNTNGIHIHCVENVKEQYRTIKQIIDEGIPED